MFENDGKKLHPVEAAEASVTAQRERRAAHEAAKLALLVAIPGLVREGDTSGAGALACAFHTLQSIGCT